MNRLIITISLLVILVVFAGCTGNYNVTKINDEDIPYTATIAISFFQAPAPDISYKATWSLISEIDQYGYRYFIYPEQVEKVLQDNKIDLYRNPSPATIFQIGQKIKARYLIAGNIITWEGGYTGWWRSQLTKVGLSLRMYDLDNGKEVWIGSAEDDEAISPFGIHKSPNDLAREMIKKVLRDTNLKDKEGKNDFF